MSEPKYRPADSADAEQIRRTLRLCFNVSDAHAAISMDRAGLGEIRVMDLGGEIQGVSYLIPMGIFFGGRTVSNLGLAAVGIPPEHRGYGLSTKMMHSVLREAHDRGFAVSTLHPATQTVYRRVGYQFFGCLYETRLRIDAIDVRDNTAGLRRYQPEDREAIRALHSRWARMFDGHLDRNEYIWFGVHQLRDIPAEGYVVTENDQITGYCFLVQEPYAGLKYNLRATDLLASTPLAARRLLNFFAGHRSLGSDLIYCGGPNDPLLMHLAEDRYEVKLRHFVMLRLLDVKRACEARGYPRLVKAKLEIELDDPLLPEQAGRWVLDIADGYGELSRGGSGALRLDAAGMAALYGQLHPAPRLAALGWLHGDPESIETARSIFAGSQASVVEMF